MRQNHWLLVALLVWCGCDLLSAQPLRVERLASPLRATSTEWGRPPLGERKFEHRVRHSLIRLVEVLPEPYHSFILERLNNDENINDIGREVASVAMTIGETYFDGVKFSADVLPPAVRDPVRRLIIESYHHKLWRWHHTNFFDLEAHLYDSELKYISECFHFAGDEHYEHVTKSERLSYFTYSHRVRGTAVNSSRFAIGLKKMNGRVVELARAVMGARGVASYGNYTASPFEDPNLTFGGLGWDIEAGHFKVYFRVRDVKQLPCAVRHDCGGGADTAEGTPDVEGGIVSWTYRIGPDRAGALHEEKVYYVPSGAKGADGATVMAASNRGRVEQHDLKDPPRAVQGGQAHRADRPAAYNQAVKGWLRRVNKLGAMVIKMYDDNGEPLDTVAFTDKNNFVLYFP